MIPKDCEEALQQALESNDVLRSQYMRALGEKAQLANRLEAVDHPPHYNKHPSGIECIEVIRHFGFNLGNVIKYVWRADSKGNDLEDLRKALWYLQDEIAKRERSDVAR